MATCIVDLQGRLGNQLFQIAATWSHAKRNGLTIALPQRGSKHWDTYLHNFKKYAGSPTGAMGGRLWNEPHWHYARIPDNARYLRGYFQSTKHFADVSEELRHLFQPDAATQGYVRNTYADLIQMRDTVVVVHVRRGDYVGLNHYHVNLGERYYSNAIAAARQEIPDAHLVVISDDIAWCRQQPWLNLGDVTFIDETSDVATLFLMTQFKHFIIANSSFSWWGAWLSGPTPRVWAPDTWFGPRGPQEFNDIYEPTWTRLAIK
jgi:hypothetical protein